jgi:hypothetical protein
MIIIAGAVFGISLGSYQAIKRKGKLADILQYAAAYGIAFVILGLFATVIIERLVV